MLININFHSHNSYQHDHHGTKGEFKVEEAYGVYSFSNRIHLYAGFLLAPFGIYNDISYITPLYAPVVLPQIENANVMLSGFMGDGSFELNYFLYISSGMRGDDGSDVNKDKGYGVRVRGDFMDNHKLGISYYSANDNKEAQGRFYSYGCDLELNLFEILKLEGEYISNSFEKRKNRYSYYGRATLHIGDFSPFVSANFAQDDANILYKRGKV